MKPLLRALAMATLVLASSCSSGSGSSGGGGAPSVPQSPTPAPDGAPYDDLDQWHLFSDAKAQVPNKGVTPYEVIAPLFSDYTSKRRFLWVPEGKKIGWKDTDRWDIPAGSIFVKTFSYPIDARDAKKGERLLETRLLVHESAAGWIAHTYVWDEAQTKAVRKVAGDTIDATWIDETGATKHNAYSVPNTNVCQECHGKTGKTGPLGGRSRQLNRDHDYGKGPENEIDHFASMGLFDVAPQPMAMRQTLVDPFGTAGTVSDRARAYLDANCSHCHGVVGLAKGTAFWLDYDHTDPVKGNPTDFGICKVPASAGGGTCDLQFDVVPGDSKNSIVPCRVDTAVPKISMPPVGHNLVHDEGVALLKAWIDAMPPQVCK